MIKKLIHCPKGKKWSFVELNGVKRVKYKEKEGSGKVSGDRKSIKKKPMKKW